MDQTLVADRILNKLVELPSIAYAA